MTPEGEITLHGTLVTIIWEVISLGYFDPVVSYNEMREKVNCILGLIVLLNL